MEQTDKGSDKLTLAIVESLKNQGLTQSEIANMYGVTRQYVSWIKKTYGGSETPRERVLKNFPWTLTTQQGQMAPARNLRNHAEYMATGGKGMSAEKLTKLRNFYKKLRDENVVVEFDPALPPEPGVSSVGGFAYRPRAAEDGDLLIRVNEHTAMNEEGKIIWRFPPREP
ncbi:XRE family transcriptional regulator [Nocardia sp. IFM 10818]